MVSSQLSGLAQNRFCTPVQTQLLFPENPTDSVVSDQVELDFSDVFGPVSVQASKEVIYADSDLSVNVEESDEIVYDDPVVIFNRSHSLVGPSSCVSQSLKLSKLTIHEMEDVEELLVCVDGNSDKKINEPSTDDDSIKKSLQEVDGDSVKVETVGIEDFEVLKVVGQGAFAKVYQVRKRGTSEIYAMKVMRKDKIMEKNHAEYMKAERDILTIIDHPFIVQLRYSFQVISYSMYLSQYASHNVL